MMRDGLGEYDENDMPRDFGLPVVVNQEHNGIADSSGSLFAFFSVIREEVPRLLAKRKCEFLCGLANGRLRMDRGRVFKQVAEQWQDGVLVVTYAAIGEKASENGHSEPNQAIAEAVGVRAEVPAKRRGNPNFQKGVSNPYAKR